MKISNLVQLLVSIFSLLYWISYFLCIASQISSNSSNVVFSIIIIENLQKIFVNNDIIETNNWTRLLIFDEKINFYFNIFLYMTSVVYCRTFLHFMSSLFNNFMLSLHCNVAYLYLSLKIFAVIIALCKLALFSILQTCKPTILKV